MSGSTQGTGMRRPAQIVSVVASAARLQAQIAAQYRANVLLWGFVRLLQTVVYIGVWRAVAQASGGETAGYTQEEFAGYFLCVLVVVEITFTWVQGQLPNMIRTGELSPRLLRPVHPLLELFGKMISYNAMLCVVLTPSIVVLWLAFDAEVHLTVVRTLAAAVVLPLAVVTRYLLDCLVAVTAFWLVRVDSIRSMSTYVGLLLGGQFAPLAVLPGPMRSVAHVLPYYWALGFPVEVLTGRAGADRIALGVLVLAAWCAVLFGVLQVTWRAGVRAYGAVGA